MVDQVPDRVRPSIPPNRVPLPQAMLGSAFLLLLLVGAVFWFVIRVEVNAGEILVLVNKTGRTLPPELMDEFGDQVVLYPELVRAIAAVTGESEAEVRDGYKGIRYEVLKEDRYCAILMGDTRRGRHFVPLAFRVMERFLKAGFVLKEDIVKVQHNCSATRRWEWKARRDKFYLIMHEHMFVFRKPRADEDLGRVRDSRS